MESQYGDNDGLLKEELASIRGPNMFSSFYDALNATREYHQKFPNSSPAYQPEVNREFHSVNFSGEEVFGKYLDLHEFYLRYCNLPNVPSREQDYLQYLDKFNSFFYIPETSKSAKVYGLYVNDLYDYLRGFFGRVQPLIDMVSNEKEIRDDFEKKWADGAISGWKPKANSSGAVNKPDHQAIRLGLFNDPSELEALGMDRLKDALEAMGLKCGGTLGEKAERLWSIRGKKPEEIPQKLKAKTKAISDGTVVENGVDTRKQVRILRLSLSVLTIQI